MQPYKILDWDSSFFGYNVAQLTDHSFDFDQIKNKLQQLGQQGVKLVYWSPLNPNHIDEKQIQSLGGKLVDIKTIYHYNLTGKSSDDFKTDQRVKEYMEPATHPDLLTLAFESGVWSRFKVDERIGQQKFEELYTIWMDQSVAKKIAKTILVSVEGSGLTGMITLGEKDGSGNIGLVAVNAADRGKGLGYALFQEMFRWFIKQGYKNITVVTQQANESACRFYEKAGFEKLSAQPFYHFWI